MSKYKLLRDQSMDWDGIKLYRIQYRSGCVGGWIQSESNLSQYNDCGVWGEAKAWGSARVNENCYVTGNASIFGNATVCGNSHVFGHTEVFGNAKISDNARVGGLGEAPKIGGWARLGGWSIVRGAALILKTQGFLTIGPIGSSDAMLTVYPDTRGDLIFTTGCFSGNEDQLVAAIQENHPDDHFGSAYLEALEFAKKKMILNRDNWYVPT